MKTILTLQQPRQVKRTIKCSSVFLCYQSVTSLCSNYLQNWRFRSFTAYPTIFKQRFYLEKLETEFNRAYFHQCWYVRLSTNTLLIAPLSYPSLSSHFLENVSRNISLLNELIFGSQYYSHVFYLPIGQIWSRATNASGSLTVWFPASIRTCQ